VDAVAVTSDGRLAVSASDDETLKVWKVGSGRELRTLAGHSGRVLSVALSGDGRLVASASNDWTLKLGKAGSGRELRTLACHMMGIPTCVALSGDGRLAVSASNDRTLRVWDLASGCELRSRVTRNLTPEECRKSLHRDDVPPIP
jgi:WD40 repeat protein